ncbi:protein of unknown function (plasmid) [Pararobbsia alpina]
MPRHFDALISFVHTGWDQSFNRATTPGAVEQS